MKNVFYFILKAFFVPKIFQFYRDFLVMYKKQLDKKDKVNFKIHDVTTMVNKLLQYTYCPISQEVKATRQ